jgi:hypothetical protein
VDTRFRSGNCKGKCHLRDLEVDGKNFKCVLQELELSLWTAEVLDLVDSRKHDKSRGDLHNVQWERWWRPDVR